MGDYFNYLIIFLLIFILCAAIFMFCGKSKKIETKKVPRKKASNKSKRKNRKPKNSKKRSSRRSGKKKMAIKNKNKAKNSKKSKAKKSKARKALNIQEAMEFAGQAMECTNLEENTWEAVADQNSISGINWQVAATQASAAASSSVASTSAASSFAASFALQDYKERLFNVLPIGVFPILFMTKRKNKRAGRGFTGYVETEIWDALPRPLTVTGNVTDIMRESVWRARVYANKFIKENNYGNIDNTKLIVDMLPASSSKDGPSGGGGILTSILSRVLGLAPLNNCAIVAEINYDGDLIAVGGLESKLNAALRTKITTIIMAKTMEVSWSKVDKAITKKFNPIFVEKYKQAFTIVFPEMRKRGK